MNYFQKMNTCVVQISCIIILLISLCSCDSEIVQSQSVMRGGILYQKGELTPFTGYVIGQDNRGHRRATRLFKKHYENGLLDGKSEFWYENGKLESIENYMNGNAHGITSRYYNNGQIRSRVHYVNGMRGGSKGEFFWYKNGKLKKG